MARVLIVDDDEDIRQTLHSLLEDIGGYTVHEAVDGLDGLAQIRMSDVSLVVLLDVLMPGLDGIEVLEAVAADQELASRHAFVLDSVSRRATTAVFPSNLSVQVLVKPFNIDDLLKVVDQAAQSLEV